MTQIEYALLISGLLFPALSWITFAAAVPTRWSTGRHASPIFIPLVGPVLLTCWVLLFRGSWWLIPTVWIADVGTLAFAIVIPRLFREWWEVSSFTRILTLRGGRGIRTVVLTFHSTGHYLLQQSWNRGPGELGIVGLSETGTFSQNSEQFDLRAHHGLQRQLQPQGDGRFVVQEHPPLADDLLEHALDGWTLSA